MLLRAVGDQAMALGFENLTIGRKTGIGNDLK
jgi:hypothetical protein